MTLKPELLRKLLALVEVTSDEEIDCSEFLDRMARFLDSIGPDGSLPEGSEAIVQHMRVCAECCEEFEALSRALHAEHEESG